MKPKLALVGAGRFGGNHLRVLMELEKEKRCTLVGVVDSKVEVLEQIAKKYAINTSTNPDDFINDVDAVDIVTPSNTHFDLCKKFLAAGKHVLVEKPLTTSYAEAKEVVGLALDQGKTLMVGHIFRYNSAVQKVKELIEKGELGQIYYMFGHFAGLKNPRTDSGAIYTYTIHHIDIYNYLLEKLPEEVTCCSGHFLERKELEDVAILTLKYPTGTLGFIEGSWLPPGKQRDLTVVGSKKSVTSDLLKQTLCLYDSYIEKHGNQFKAIDQGSKELKVEFKEPLKLELLEFMKSIKTGRKPLSDGQAALASINIIENALKSAKLGRTVRLKQ
ncbi:MAG: Gfo/Idh/MocA family oxidoreductase [Candidatus Bathyarchaeota archaeon]|jgi:predicted dehydrogenase